ncbi:sigma 54-interacting transcriptional regulator [Haloimpatiens sp. FM7330]|uniref:sigma 54-interacting transcriptional regulator n=1 Tax=Haloimpatiens sp. FM7330 TaxID=3298610 RepID=UPI0036278C4B
MKRIEKIYNCIEEKCKECDLGKLKEIKGFSAQDIGDDLSILRNNVSKELNELLRMDKIIKIKGRPVLYFHKESIENMIKYKLPKGPIEINSINELIKDDDSKDTEKNPFQFLIGAETSLKNQIEQAKAAIIYPPNGLHTLIVGQTGVGKTLFANMMYNYGKHIKKFNDKTPFIVFNCADYYNNPQLLISHIFGHSKGAFTGADCEKEGLVEKANGGILFLDEIHRLSPEGQEMIFYFMDTGTYNKLGENDRNRKANVLIVGATTEDPDSVLLKTFIRRIPIIITIPTFDERVIKDKIDIIKYLISNEAHRVKKPIRITRDAVKALIGSASYGNIGQLKSNIQLICAKGFLNSINKKDCIDIDLKMLPNNIKNGFISISAKRKESEQISLLIGSNLMVMPEKYRGLIQEDPYELPFNLYKIIEDKASVLKEEGMDDEYIKKFITTDINIHIKCFYDKFKNDTENSERILKIVDKKTLDFAGEIKSLVEQRLNRKLTKRFLYALSLHLGAFFKRIKNQTPIKYANIESTIKDNPEEYKVALDIKNMIENKYNIKVPEMEVIYLTLLLSSVEDEKEDGCVSIIVAAHGSSTASSMVKVAQKLLGYVNITSIDMPLEVSPEEILDEMTEKVKEVDRGKGVLLLVDMGSLMSFGSIISEKTNIRVKTIDMVSTPLVLEAVRKANISDMDLESIYNSLKDFKGYSTFMDRDEVKNEDGVIITICSTGEGAAVKLKELVEDIIYNVTDSNIPVIPIGIKDLKKQIDDISEQKQIIASIGIVNPKINVPFISLESLINGEGEKALKDIIRNNNIKIVESDENIMVKDLCEDSLKQFLTYLNPDKVISVLMDFVSVLEKEMKKKFSNSMSIRLIIHTGCALERMVLKDGLKYEYDKSKLDKDILQYIKKAVCVFKDTLNIKLNDDEICYIAEMFK